MDWHSLQQQLQALAGDRRPLVADAASQAQWLQLALQLLETGDFQERWQVTKLIPQFGAAAIAPVLNCLVEAEDDWELQWHLIRTLGQINHPDAIAALSAQLCTAQHPDVAQAAAIALSSLGNAAIPALETALRHPSARPLAAQTLAQIDDPAIIPILLTVVHDAEPSVRRSAIEALTGFPDETLQQQFPALSSIMLAALQDPNASVRAAAVTGLGLRSHQFDSEWLVQHLRPLLYDLDLAVCQQTANALSRLGTAASIAALSDLLRSPHTPEPLSKAAIRALVWMETPEAIAALTSPLHHCLDTLDTLDTLGSSAIAQDLIASLGQVQSPSLQQPATDLLLSGLDRRPFRQWPPALLNILAIALGRLQQPAALHPLIQFLRHPHTAVQLHAIAALKHFDTAHAQLQALHQAPTTSPALKAGIAIALQEWDVSEGLPSES